jgi:exodeoxyribonuclease V alpha subunit
MTQPNALTLITQWREAGVIGPLGHRFAEALARLINESDPQVLLAAALTAEGPLHGDTCLDLPRLPLILAGRSESGEVPVEVPEAGPWLAQLKASPLVSDRAVGAPLVLAGHRLYLERYWRHQTQLVSALRTRIGHAASDDHPQPLIDGLRRMFPGATPDDGQRLAALVAVLNRFSVITGGPGTGKTTTVVRVLALLIEHAHTGGHPSPRIALLAPTGKAAARMSESIRRQVGKLDVSATVRAAIPVEAATLHRALGARPGSTRTRYDAHNPLTADVVVVDEASMVDLALMARLFDALRPQTRLILLGDRDQLASVEAGSVLGDLCAAGDRAFSSAAAARMAPFIGPLPDAWIDPAQAPGLGDAVVHLRHTWRFGPDSGIGQLAAAMNAGDSAKALTVLDDAHFGDAQRLALDPADPVTALRTRCVRGYTPLGEAHTPAEALDALGQFRVLCAHREGALGVRIINQRIERWLADAGIIAPDERWYAGRPVMVIRNDYHTTGLFNGDVGVVRPGPDGPRVWFPGPPGEPPRAVAPARLPPHETVYATTVHKAQGSEFEHVTVVLPAHISPIVTRELLYTGVTRARRQVTIIGSDVVFAAGVASRVERASGLHDELQAALNPTR